VPLTPTSVGRAIKGFFVQCFDEDGLIHSEDYERKVLPLGKNAFEASVN
jgi:hypothetical protein